MNKYFRFILTFSLCLSVVVHYLGIGSSHVFGATEKNISEPITIMFTSDLHSNLDGFPALASAINKVQADNKNTILVDAGDFSMGTIYQSIYKDEAPELGMFDALGYDAFTIGNHEFDYKLSGLTEMFNTASAKGYNTPFVIPSMDWETTLQDKTLADDALAFYDALSTYGANNFSVVEKAGIKIGIISLIGNDAINSTSKSGFFFNNPFDYVQSALNNLKNQHPDTDLIICLSHSGTSPNPMKSEDELLAKKFPEIDVIISGHSHTTLEKPIIIKDTVIGSSGSNCASLGVMTLSQNKEGGFSLDSYKLLNLQDFPQDSEISSKLTTYKNAINNKYLSHFGYATDQLLAYNPYKFTSIPELEINRQDEALANLITDSFIRAVKQSEGGIYEPVDVAILPLDSITNVLPTGKISVSNVFNTLSSGSGSDGTSGYPLLTFYLTGKELKTIAEVDAFISNNKNTNQLYCSGLTYKYNPNRFFMNKSYDVALLSESGNKESIESNKLYRVACDLGTIQMFETVKESSHNILKIRPKDKAGKLITDFEKHILPMDSAVGASSGELKEWYALASYINAFPTLAEGLYLPTIPTKYNKSQERKIMESSTSVSSLIKQPNIFTFGFLISIVLGILFLCTILYLTARKILPIIKVKMAEHLKN